ncbi:MAG TPA: purine-nucleoside phosphorylase [Longilinea sp.]|nr:purine-nucleoside phosphorylase [Longilinea sp.]
MSEYVTLQEIERATDFIKQRVSLKPRVGMILGSGLGQMVDAVTDQQAILFKDIPGWPVTTVQGHEGRLVFGKLEDVPVVVMQGRIHFYEGYSLGEVTMPIRVMQLLGIEVLIVTNASGAVNPDYAPGDVMLINDHLSLIAMTGINPLRGPNLDSFGERFPDMSQAYDRELLKLAHSAAKNAGVSVHEGVYICLSGPSFETPADLRFLRMIGADAVGMSTVPEVIVAHHGGVRSLGLSGVSNKANLDGNTVTTHEEVLQAGQVIGPKMIKIIRGVLSTLK